MNATEKKPSIIGQNKTLKKITQHATVLETKALTVDVTLISRFNSSFPSLT